MEDGLNRRPDDPAKSSALDAAVPVCIRQEQRVRENTKVSRRVAVEAIFGSCGTTPATRSARFGTIFGTIRARN
jgi:hypothetical protein